MMKNKFNKKISTLVVFLLINLAFGQAKKPTLMVIPSDNWCIANGYFIEVNNQGNLEKRSDYKKALQESSELLQAIATINDLMAEKGFPLENLESAIKTFESESAENNLAKSKTGAGISNSQLDKLKSAARADIVLQLTWSITTTGPKKSINYTLQGLDAYSNKQIAGATDSGKPSTQIDIPFLLSEVVVAKIDVFCARLLDHFNDMRTYGREIVVRIKKFDSWKGDLETEYEGKELKYVIREWMTKNTVEGRNSPKDLENSMEFKQVRIPLYDPTTGYAMDAQDFAKGLQTFLKNAPYNITAKLTMKGLGEATLNLGEK